MPKNYREIMFMDSITPLAAMSKYVECTYKNKEEGERVYEITEAKYTLPFIKKHKIVDKKLIDLLHHVPYSFWYEKESFQKAVLALFGHYSKKK